MASIAPESAGAASAATSTTAPSAPNADEISRRMRGVQQDICEFLEQRSGQRFREDSWDYPKGTGGGITRVLELEHAQQVQLNDLTSAYYDGSGRSRPQLLEKGGVNFSDISGTNVPAAAVQNFRLPADSPFRAMGVSLVIHPSNPHVPTIHMNIRYFQITPPGGDAVWWFGGGIDLTPYYPRVDHVAGFHAALHALCTAHSQPAAKYKDECDVYFSLPHRTNEMRGVGGIFFDSLKTPSPEAALDFVIALGMAFRALYAPFIDDFAAVPYTPAQREFQLLRRGRYVEFNLAYDRGTKFGLQSNGRTESILMSLPATARWVYNWTPASPASPEAAMVAFYLRPQSWLSLDPAKRDELRASERRWYASSAAAPTAVARRPTPPSAVPSNLILIAGALLCAAAGSLVTRLLLHRP